MTDALSLTPKSSIQAVDSLSVNEIVVELDGQRATGIFRITGFVPFKLDVKPSLIKLTYDPFKIVKMAQRDPTLPMNRWLFETLTAKDDIARPIRILDIVAVDDGVETRRWRVKGAWISEVAYSDFDTGSGELVQEILVIQYDTIETIWVSS